MGEYNNISNGITDGFVLFYMKDGKLKSVGLNKDEADRLDIILGTVFTEPATIIEPNKGIMKKLLEL